MWKTKKTKFNDADDKLANDLVYGDKKEFNKYILVNKKDEYDRYELRKTYYIPTAEEILEIYARGTSAVAFPPKKREN